MFYLIVLELKKTKNVIMFFVILLILLSIYTLLDNYGYQTYTLIGDAFGYDVVIQTITLNVIISLLSSFMISITVINYRFTRASSSGSLFASIGNVFAIIFTGCASCGVSLLGAIGVSLGVSVLPGAVKYKFFALLVIILGLIIVVYLINTSTCSIKKGGKS